MKTITASKARENLYRLIEEAAQSSEPVQITGKRANAVLVSWRLVFTKQAQKDAKKLAAALKERGN
jgi:hypothetical protein